MTLPIGLALAAPLAPLLWWQGRRVRRITPVLPEPPGRRQGRLAERLDGPPARLLLLGDSSAAGVGAPDQPSALSGQLLARLDSHLTRPLHWRLVARTGLRTREAIDCLDAPASARDESIAAGFDLAVIALGVNDVTALQSPSAWLRDVDRLVDDLHIRHGVQRILWSGLPPMHRFPALPQPLRAVLGQHARVLDRALAQQAMSARTACELEHVPLPEMSEASLIASDGFHPGPGAYALWARELSGRVLQALSVPSRAQALTASLSACELNPPTAQRQPPS